jgi:hypothetical protein
MGANALGRRIACLSTAIALTTACTRTAMPPRVPGPLAEGAAESQPADGAAAPSAPPPPSSADGSHPGHDPHRTRRVLGWVTLSIGAEAAVIAIATSLMIEHQKSIRDDGCDAAKVCTAKGLAATSTIDTLVPWNTASWFVAAAGLGAGTVLLLVSQPESERKTAVTLAPASSGLTLGVRSTF